MSGLQDGIADLIRDLTWAPDALLTPTILVERIESMQDLADGVDARVEELTDEVVALTADCAELEEANADLEKKIKKLTDKLDQMVRLSHPAKR